MVGGEWRGEEVGGGEEEKEEKEEEEGRRRQERKGREAGAGPDRRTFDP